MHFPFTEISICRKCNFANYYFILKLKIIAIFDRFCYFQRMPYEDFIEHFSNVSIVHVNMNAFYNDPSLNRRENFKWDVKSYHGEWQAGVNAGGGSDGSTFWTNPQYLITLKDVDLSDNDNKATVIVSLMQKGSVERRIRNSGALKDESIQFRVYRVLNNTGAISKFRSSQNLKLVGDSGKYSFNV
jgi:hypothetical protein